MVNLENAKLNPGKVFHRPIDVIKDTSLSREQKIDILRRWAYDEREKAVAEEENMLADDSVDNNNILDEILTCLIQLKASEDPASPPTKQG